MGNTIEICNRKSNKYHFAVVSVQTTDEKGRIIPIEMIVIKDKQGNNVLYTDFHLYVQRMGKPLQSKQRSNKKELTYITQCLNFLIFKENIKKISEVEKKDLEAFFNMYAAEESINGRPRSENTCMDCVNTVCRFFLKVIEYEECMNISEEDLYKYETYTDRFGYEQKRKNINFTINTYKNNNLEAKWKEISYEAVMILIQCALEDCPEIAIGIAIMAFSGLRIGETCNVRQIDSSLGAGLIIAESRGKFLSVRIKQDYEFKLRDDGTEIGRMKSHRDGYILNDFLDLFKFIYTNHLHLIENVKQSPEKPLLINEKGKAMSTDSFRYHFKKLVNKSLVKKLQNCESEYLRMEGRMIERFGLTPHALRTFYTIYCAKQSNNPIELAGRRRDKDITSSVPYMIGKSPLIGELDRNIEDYLNKI